MAENSRYVVLRRVAIHDLGAEEKPARDEAWRVVGTVEGHDFRDAILAAAGEAEGEYVAIPAARWEGNRDEVVVRREPVVTLRSRAQRVPA